MRENNLIHRRFLHVAALTLALGVWCSLAARFAVGEEPLLRFVQLNDTHVDSRAPSDYRLANEKLRYLVAAFNAGTYFPTPDFIIGVGDIIDGGELTAVERDYTALKPILAELKCPFYPVIGNHEDNQQEGDAQYEAMFRAAYGGRHVNYTFRQGKIEFVILDNSGAPSSNRTEVGRRRNCWLRDVLEGSKYPKIICCHIPIVPIREEAVLAKSFGFGSYAAIDDELLKLVDSHSRQIIAVLSGHLHLTGMVRRKGVHHISISGTGSFPCDFACYEVFADRIRVRVHGLPKEMTTPDTDIHGKPRYKIDYIDATHPTHW